MEPERRLLSEAGGAGCRRVRRPVSTPPGTYLVERYWSGVTRADVRSAVRRLTEAVSAMRREGTRIRHLRSVLVPADESLLCLFEAADPEDVAAANRRAGVPFDRISVALDVVRGSGG